MEGFKRRGLIYLALRRGGFWLVLPVLMGGIVGAIGFGILGDADEFANRGRVAKAVIISTSIRELRSPGSGNVSKIPTASVRFSVNGREVFASARISQQRYDSEPAGQSISVLYLPEDPTRIEIEPGGNFRYGLILTGVLSVLIAFWVTTVVRAFRFARRAIYVRNNGTRKTVSVIEHEAPMFTSDQNPETCLVWKDTSGKVCRSLPIRVKRAGDYRVGMDIQIYEMPGSELDSVWEGDVGRA